MTLQLGSLVLATAYSPLDSVQEFVAVKLRKLYRPCLDGLLAVVREFLNPDISRFGLDHCLQQHGVVAIHAG